MLLTLIADVETSLPATLLGLASLCAALSQLVLAIATLQRTKRVQSRQDTLIAHTATIATATAGHMEILAAAAGTLSDHAHDLHQITTALQALVKPVITEVNKNPPA